MKSERLDRAGAIAVAITLLFWSSAFVGIRYGLRSYSPGHLVLVRFLVASVVFVGFAAIGRVHLPPRSELGRIAICGFTGISIYHLALTFGEEAVPAGIASLLIATAPVFTALLGRLVLNERLSRLGWLGMVGAFFGIAMIALDAPGGNGFTGDAVLVLGASVATAVFFVAEKPLLARHDALEVTAWVTWAGTLPICIFAGGLFQQIASAPILVTLDLVYIGIFPAALAYVAWNFALAKAPASRVSVYLYLNPLLTTVEAVLALGEIPSGQAVLGGVVALAGVIVVSVFGRPGRRLSIPAIDGKAVAK